MFDRDGRGYEDFPGMSGCPVMVPRRTKGGIEIVDMVGIFFEDRQDLDVYRARPIGLIKEDGTIAG